VPGNSGGSTRRAPQHEAHRQPSQTQRLKGWSANSSVIETVAACSLILVPPVHDSAGRVSSTMLQAPQLPLAPSQGYDCGLAACHCPASSRMVKL
jgi:hypothetical protein